MRIADVAVPVNQEIVDVREQGLAIEVSHNPAVPGEQSDGGVGERESQDVRLLALDVRVGARGALLLA